MGLIGSGPTGNSSSSLLMTRFRRTKPSNAYWLGRSMEQLQTAAVGGGGIRDDKGSPSLPPSMGTLAAGPGSATSTPGRVPRHRLPTDPSGSASTLPTTMTSTSASSTDLQHQQLTDTNGDHPPKCKSFIHLFLRVILWLSLAFDDSCNSKVAADSNSWRSGHGAFNQPPLHHDVQNADRVWPLYEADVHR